MESTFIHALTHHKLRCRIKVPKFSARGKMETALAILMIGLGAYLLLTSSSILFNFNWNQKTNIEKIKMVIFYAVLIYLMNVVFWIFD